MRTEVSQSQLPLPGWLISLCLLPLALFLGFSTGDSLTLLVAGSAALFALVAFGCVPLAAPVKLIFLVISVAFLQRLLGYFKVGEVRGANVGNLLLLLSFGYWIYAGLQKGTIYRRTPIDLWLFIAVVAIPCTSFAIMFNFRDLPPGYTQTAELVWYKQWVTPFVYFFLLCQCLETKRDVRLLFYLILGLVGLVVLEGMPEVLSFGNWRESRSEGIVGQANDYAALLATTVPFFLLLLFLYHERLLRLGIALVMLGCMGVSLLTTYSRAGYIGFFLALMSCLYIAYRTTGQLRVLGPAVLVTTICLLPVIAVPQVWDSLASRFETKTYKRAERKSYSKFETANQFSGGRLEIWKAALRMAEERPIFGQGFHAFRYVLPRYHYQSWSNYCHSQFLGTLAECGIIGLVALCTLYWKLLRLLYHNWLVVFAQKDRTGIFICGGALVSFLVMLFVSTMNDFMNPGPKSTVFWVVMAGAIRYAMLAREETAPKTSWLGNAGLARGQEAGAAAG